MKEELIIKNRARITKPQQNRACPAKLQRSRGSSLIEILVAVALLTLSLGAVIMLVFANQNLKIDSLTNNEAIAKAEQLLEDARALSRTDFSSVATLPPAADGIYTKSTTVTDIDSFTKQVTSNVSWNISSSRPVSVSLTTMLTDPQSALGGDTCNPVLSGDWTRPQDFRGGYGYFDFTSPSGTSGVDSANKKVYVTTDVTGKPDFYVVDASNPKPAGLYLPKLGLLQTGYGLTDVRVVGKYAYVTVDSTAYQLFVIDISNPGALSAASIVKKIRVTPAGDTAYGNTIYYSKRKIYLGLTKSTGTELHIFDISADPANPQEVGPGFETDTSINQIVVKDNFSYLGTALFNNAYIVDVANPLAPVQINPTKQTFADPSGVGDWSGQSIAVSQDASKIYVGRQRDIGNTARPDLYILNTSDLSASPLGILTQTKNDGFTRMTIRGNLLFTSNADSNDGFQIWDVSVPSSPVRYDTTPLNVQQASTAGMDCDGNLIYLGQRSNHALQIIGPGSNLATLALSIHDGAHNSIATANVGDTVHAGLNASGAVGNPTGNINFTFYTNLTCSAGATSAGTVGLVSGAAHPSNNEGPLNAGSYSFNAHYVGDTNYDPVDACVALTVPKITPSISTTIYNNATGLPITTATAPVTIYDKAVVSGGAIAPTGNVTFQRYSNFNAGNCTGSHTDETIALGAGGTINSSNFTKSTAGKVCYKVQYAGDINYNAVNATFEPLTVN